jgi:hypothetical protein
MQEPDAVAEILLSIERMALREEWPEEEGWQALVLLGLSVHHNLAQQQGVPNEDARLRLLSFIEAKTRALQSVNGHWQH